jgi:hypothetical protein
MGSTLPSCCAYLRTCQYLGELMQNAARRGEFIQLGRIDLVTHGSLRHYHNLFSVTYTGALISVAFIGQKNRPPMGTLQTITVIYQRRWS